MSTYLNSTIEGPLYLSLDNIFNNYDFLTSIGMEPYGARWSLVFF